MSIHGEDAEMEKSRIFRKETESIILFTSTADFEFLYRYLTDQKNTCRIVIPENRLGTPKIQAISGFGKAHGSESKLGFKPYGAGGDST